jgi:hypothetical protein
MGMRLSIRGPVAAGIMVFGRERGAGFPPPLFRTALTLCGWCFYQTALPAWLATTFQMDAGAVLSFP